MYFPMTFWFGSDVNPDPHIPLVTNGSGCGIPLFSSDGFKTPTKNNFFLDKSSRSHKTVEIKVFLHFLLVDGRIRIRICANIRDPDADPGSPKTCGSYRSGSGYGYGC
jgi:hypothetical protein